MTGSEHTCSLSFTPCPVVPHRMGLSSLETGEIINRPLSPVCCLVRVEKIAVNESKLVTANNGSSFVLFRGQIEEGLNYNFTKNPITEKSSGKRKVTTIHK